MNKTVLKKIEAIAGQISDARSYLDEVREDEQATYDGHSDRWQESDRGEMLWSTISNLETAVELLEELEGLLEAIAEGDAA